MTEGVIMSEKLSREEWKAEVLKLLENTSIDREPMTMEKVEELRSDMLKKFAELTIEELKLLTNKENANDT